MMQWKTSRFSPIKTKGEKVAVAEERARMSFWQGKGCLPDSADALSTKSVWWAITTYRYCSRSSHMGEPDILLFDESISALDPENGREKY